MTSTHEALVRRPLDDVRRQLGDVDPVLGSLPGATLERDDDGVSGSLKLKLGTLQITYRVTIRATGPEGGDHVATVTVTGKEARGAGTLGATVDVSLHEAEGGTLVRARLDLTATGRGESVSDAAWAAAAESLLDGVVAGLQDVATGTDDPPVAAPRAATTDAARAASNGVAATASPAVHPLPLRDPSTSVRWSAADSVASSSGPSPRRLAVAASLLVLLLVVLRRRRRRR
jgi:carbon monoxide dehydrogenase subunit G